MANAPITVLRVGILVEADTAAAKSNVASFRGELQQLANIGGGGPGALGEMAAAAGQLTAVTAPMGAAAAAAGQAIQEESQAAAQATAAMASATGAASGLAAAENAAAAGAEAGRRALVSEAEAATAATAAHTKLSAANTNTAAQTNVAGAGARRFGLFAQQAGYQVQDFSVQVAAGQNVLVAFAQQGSQLLGVFGIWGALAGAGLAIFAGLANGLGLFTSSSKENDDALKLHQKTLDDWIALGGRAKQTADALAYSFAGMSDATREVIREQLQVKIDEQIGATKAAADAALKAIRDTNTEFVPGHQSLDLATGQQVAIPAHLEFDADFKVPADLKAKLQTALQPLFEGNRKSDYLTGLYDQLVDLGKGATGPAKTMIESWTKAVAGLSAGAEIGGEKIEVMEARMRILNGTATEADRVMVDAAAAADHLGKAFGGAGDLLDHLILGIDTFLGQNLARGIADKAETFAGAFGRAFQAAATQADVQRGIQSDLDDAAATAGGKAAERARARQKAVDQAGEAAAAKLAAGGVVIGVQDQIDAARDAKGKAFDADAAKKDAAEAASAAKRSNAWTQESERITKATQDMRTQADTIGLTTRAAAELKAQQDLLNAAHQAGIPVTDAMLAKIKAQAVAYGDASEALRKLQSQERQRQQLGGEAVSLIGSTATDEETQTRELARLQQIRALVQGGDPGTLDRLREAGYTQDDAKTAVDRQISRVANPEIYGALDGARDSFKSFVEALTGGSAEGVDAVTALGDSLEKLALDKLVVQPLDKLANQAFDQLGAIATKDGGGWLGGLLGISSANDNGAAAATAAATTAANASISVGAATINVGSGVPGLGGALGLGGGGIPNRPDIASTGTAPAAGIAGGTGLPSLGGGVGTDTLVAGTNQIGTALQGVAQGVSQQGQSFLGGFGGALGQLINGIGSLLGGASSGAGDFLTGIIGALGFADGAGFSNGRVITSPTIFPMDGGGIGIIREKLHDEAIMPLVNAGGAPSVKARGPGGKIVPLPIARLPDGSLGVSASNVTPFAAGGAFGGGSSWSGGGGDAAIGVTLINQTSAPLGAPKVEQRRNSQGGRDLRLTFEEMVGGALADPNSAASRGLQTPTLRGRG
jgi:hypothetical protein